MDIECLLASRMGISLRVASAFHIHIGELVHHVGCCLARLSDKLFQFNAGGCALNAGEIQVLGETIVSEIAFLSAVPPLKTSEWARAGVR